MSPNSGTTGYLLKMRRIGSVFTRVGEEKTLKAPPGVYLPARHSLSSPPGGLLSRRTMRWGRTRMGLHFSSGVTDENLLFLDDPKDLVDSVAQL